MQTRQTPLWSIDTHDAKPSTWWWWFWLFFIKDKQERENPRQLMILWSTKNCQRIKVNGLDVALNHDLLAQAGNKFHGAVASWYYDGKDMHEDFVLKECNLSLAGNGIESDAGTYSSTISTSPISGDRYLTKIKQGSTDMRFTATPTQNDFAKPTNMKNTFFKKFDFKFFGINHFGLDGEIDGEKIGGSAYLQKVQVNAPSPPWLWGVAHFESGAGLTYFTPYLGTAIFNKHKDSRLDQIKFPIKREIDFFDGKKSHLFNKARIREIQGGETPAWQVSSKQGPGIKFTVETYAHACWRFEEKKILRNVLHYNEYPMRITEFKMGDLSLDDLGPNMGNAEHTWGRLL